MYTQPECEGIQTLNSIYFILICVKFEKLGCRRSRTYTDRTKYVLMTFLTTREQKIYTSKSKHALYVCSSLIEPALYAYAELLYTRRYTALIILCDMLFILIKI